MFRHIRCIESVPVKPADPLKQHIDRAQVGHEEVRIDIEGLLERFQAPGLLCSTQGLRYGLARLAAEEWKALRSAG